MLIQEYYAEHKDCGPAKAAGQPGIKCTGSDCMSWEYSDKRVVGDFELTTVNKQDFDGFCAQTYGPPKCRVKMKGI